MEKSLERKFIEDSMNYHPSDGVSIWGNIVGIILSFLALLITQSLESDFIKLASIMMAYLGGGLLVYYISKFLGGMR